jgi:hypothetical protein
MSSPLGSLRIVTVDDATDPQTGCGTAAAASTSLPPARRLPPWLRRNLEPGGGHGETADLIAELERSLT